MDKKTISFYTPGVKRYSNEYHENDRGTFLTVSVTGKRCSLDCAHCGKNLLDTMIDCSSPEALLKAAEVLKKNGGEGLLVSGGADENGAVPLLPFLSAVRQVKDMGLKVICHTGIAEDIVIRGLREAGVDKVLLDIIGSRETVRNVYGIDRGPEDYERCLAICYDIGLPVAPHIVLGMDFGQFEGEYKALEIVSAYLPDTIAIVVLKSIRSTKMEGVEPPPSENCISFMETARALNPKASLSLGCARPAGEYSVRLERAAIDLGFDSIAFPSPETVKYVLSNGFGVSFRDICCVME
jgi:lipoyl synthase